jgi:tetratricopeptide (TPR) repeat protein
MGREDWFRNEKWDAETETRFFEKLGRARDKAQPLRIQAWCLRHENPRAALALLDQYFALGDNFDKAMALLDQAEAYLTLGAQEEALQSLKSALQREHEYPNVKTCAWSLYTLLVAEKKLDHLYDDALKVLLENPIGSHSLPVDGFLWNAASALIADDQGFHRDAAELAARAMRFAELAHSGFRRHPNIGLVGSEYDNLKKKLHKVARGASLLSPLLKWGS